MGREGTLKIPRNASMSMYKNGRPRDSQENVGKKTWEGHIRKKDQVTGMIAENRAWELEG